MSSQVGRLGKLTLGPSIGTDCRAQAAAVQAAERRGAAAAALAVLLDQVQANNALIASALGVDLSDVHTVNEN